MLPKVTGSSARAIKDFSIPGRETSLRALRPGRCLNWKWYGKTGKFSSGHLKTVNETIMPDFRFSQNQASPAKTNSIMAGIIFMLIINISVQIWLLFGALNNALQDNLFFAIATFAGSAALALFSFWILRFLPDPLKSESKK
jgi:hypothetical protein